MYAPPTLLLNTGYLHQGSYVSPLSVRPSVCLLTGLLSNY